MHIQFLTDSYLLRCARPPGGRRGPPGPAELVLRGRRTAASPGCTPPLHLNTQIDTGCSLNIVIFFKYFKIFRTLFSPGVSVCTHTRQVEHQRRSRTGRVQKIQIFFRKNTIFNEHPVCKVELLNTKNVKYYLMSL